MGMLFPGYPWDPNLILLLLHSPPLQQLTPSLCPSRYMESKLNTKWASPSEDNLALKRHLWKFYTCLKYVRACLHVPLGVDQPLCGCSTSMERA